MLTCASCQTNACRERKLDQLPTNCPCLRTDEQEAIKACYLEPDNHLLAYHSALVESSGYCRNTRIEEIIAFAKRCGYTHLGIAFCVGLVKEANIFAGILREQGFQVDSIICKNGAIPKSYLGLTNNEV